MYGSNSFYLDGKNEDGPKKHGTNRGLFIVFKDYLLDIGSL